MDKNHDDQCARVKDPEMGLFSSANSYNQLTTRNPVICQFRRKVRLISTLLPVSYANSKICATDSMTSTFKHKLAAHFSALAMVYLLPCKCKVVVMVWYMADRDQTLYVNKGRNSITKEARL